jgi:protease-4
MRRTVLFFALLVVCPGCSMLEPIKVQMQGNLNANAYTYTPPNNTAPRMRTVVVGDPCNYGDAKVGIIDVDGVLLNKNMTGLGSMGENPLALFREKLDAAAADPSIRAIVLRINSPGGGVAACDAMRHDLEAFRARTGLPMVASLLDVGAGGAYYLALSADVIVAQPTSITGGMGVILNLYNLTEAMNLQNIAPTPIRAGENIDLGSPVKLWEEPEREILQRIANDFHSRYRRAVQAARPEHPPLPEDFDGRVFAAPEALERRLVDQIGYLDDAILLAKQSAGLPPDARVALFRRCNDRALTIYDVTPNISGQTGIFPLSLPGLDRALLPTFLYMWQPEPLLEKTGGR